MNDAEYLFKCTSLERKRNGIGDFHKKRRGGKFVRLASDKLTKKEREALNGEVKTYRFSKPVKWKDFIRMPDDIKQEYLDILMEKFPGVSNAMIAESMGIPQNQLSPYLCKHGLKFKGRVRMSDGKFFVSEAGIAWKKWHNDYRCPVIPEEEVVLDEVAPEVGVEEAEVVAEEVKVDVGKEADVWKIAELIKALSGSGAKVTIEFVL